MVVLIACGPANEAPCPPEGDNTPRCRAYGEFKAGSVTFRIPDRLPNQYRWFGRVEYNPKTKVLSSPGLAMHWTTGRAAGTAGGADSDQDVVRFSISYHELTPPGDLRSMAERGLFPIEESLPFDAAGLKLWGKEGATLFHPFGDGVADIYPFVAVDDLGRPTATINCVARRSASSRKVGGHCSARFNPYPSVEVVASFNLSEMGRAREVISAVEEKLHSWEVR